MKILIADDDPVFVRLLDVRLRKEGFQTFIAVDAFQTMTAAHDVAPHVILLDVKMPGGNGIDVLRRFRNSAKTSHIPVIVISVAADPSLPVQAKQAGAAEFFPKPVDFDALCFTIRRITGAPSPAPAKVV